MGVTCSARASSQRTDVIARHPRFTPANCGFLSSTDRERELNPALFEGRPLLKPMTMSLFGMLNWLFMCFRDRGPVSRDDYAELATDLLVNGVRALD